MSSEESKLITKGDLDTYLKETAKEFRKLNRKAMRAELILIGGAAVLMNYGFRGMTTDVDAVIQASSSMKDAINRVGDRYHLPYNWLNADFVRTESYSPKLAEYSTYYKTFSNVVEVRTVAAEYLIAMKLRSGRRYKHDLSDVMGVLSEHKSKGNPITMEQIRKAVCDLYGDWTLLPEYSRQFIEWAMRDGRYESLYEQAVSDEQSTKNDLERFEDDYPGALNEDNVDSIIANLQRRREQKPSLRQSLQAAKEEASRNQSGHKNTKKKDLER